MQSTIKLFKALPVESKAKKKTSNALLQETINRGFIFSPEVISNYPEPELLKITKEIGLTSQQMNSSFHKSWEKIKEADIMLLVMEQMIHYFTTYGFEGLGIYDKDSIYIPNEKLDLPVKEDINLIVIKGYTKKELKCKLLNLLSTGIALNEDTMTDIVDIALLVDLDEADIETIKNKEIKVVMYDYLNIIPDSPVEFLRYIFYKSINKTLLIKSPEIIAEIKNQDNINLIKLFVKYEKKIGFEKLATIFYRFKPIFLALRTNRKLKIIINKIRRLAAKHHKPLPEDYLNTITAKIERYGRVNIFMLKKELERVNIFRKIRLAYALKYRTNDVKSILYKVRNGKGFATEFDFKNKTMAKRVLGLVLASISSDISKNVKGKKIYIPENIEYTLPATEKQFTGNLPSGSYVSVSKDMVMGIYWDNVNGHRIDLDLSLINPDTGKIGWDSNYRTEDKSILFSGDMTDAQNGASELFYMKRQRKGAFIVFVNYYNFDSEVEVPYKIIVGQENVKNLNQNYMVNPNNVISIVESKIKHRQKVLGLLVTTINECRFYFAETILGKSITSTDSEFVEHSRKYLFDFYENTISLRDMLVKAGAIMVYNDINNNHECDIDLSLEATGKDTILTQILSHRST